MLDGMGEATAVVTPAVAFAFLANPRHAGAWFAGAAIEAPPQGLARAGLEWSFAQTPGTRRIQPMRMTVYEPPTRFVWETTFRSPLATNFVFEMRCEPVEIATEATETTETAETTEPTGQTGELRAVPSEPKPSARSSSREAPVQGTRLRFTIELRPGLVQWASIAAGFVLLRRALRERAQQAAERAASAVESSVPSSPISREGSGSQRGGSKRRNRPRR